MAYSPHMKNNLQLKKITQFHETFRDLIFM